MTIEKIYIIISLIYTKNQTKQNQINSPNSLNYFLQQMHEILYVKK
jgi:hypothetical protein